MSAKGPNSLHLQNNLSNMYSFSEQNKLCMFYFDCWPSNYFTVFYFHFWGTVVGRLPKIGRRCRTGWLLSVFTGNYHLHCSNLQVEIILLSKWYTYITISEVKIITVPIHMYIQVNIILTNVYTCWYIYLSAVHWILF